MIGMHVAYLPAARNAHQLTVKPQIVRPRGLGLLGEQLVLPLVEIQAGTLAVALAYPLSKCIEQVLGRQPPNVALLHAIERPIGPTRRAGAVSLADAVSEAIVPALSLN